jgi:hypothetical protein
MKIHRETRVMSERIEAAAAETKPAETEAVKPEAAKPEAAKPEAAKPEAAKPEMPRAAQIDAAKAPIRNLPVLHKPVVAEKPRSRFALLAATVALAACGGAVAGSLGTAGIERMLAPAPAAPVQVSAAPDQSTELKALREQVAQLRIATRQLGDSLTAARASMSQTTTATTGQLAKITETVERIERAERKEAERREKIATTQAAAAVAAAPPAPQAQAPAPEVTGSINPPALSAGRPVKPVVPGWTLRRVVDGGAVVGGPFGVIEIEPGERVPGLGRIEEIRREDGRWVVVTQKGLIVQR